MQKIMVEVVISFGTKQFEDGIPSETKTKTCKDGASASAVSHQKSSRKKAGRRGRGTGGRIHFLSFLMVPGKTEIVGKRRL